MDPLHHGRLAQRYKVRTTPIQWNVITKGRVATSSRLKRADAAIIEVSVIGAAIVATDRQLVPLGARVQIFWGGMTGWVRIRRAARYPGSADLVLFGVEYDEPNSPIGAAIFAALVSEPESADVPSA